MASHNDIRYFPCFNFHYLIHSFLFCHILIGSTNRECTNSRDDIISLIKPQPIFADCDTFFKMSNIKK